LRGPGAGPAYTQAEVHHQLADSGARILVTVGLEVIDEIPKSAAGNILRRVLRDSART
jgi:acyl-CoA synthetase (AMP-forming)/AMP-acid ligase II